MPSDARVDAIPLFELLLTVILVVCSELSEEHRVLDIDLQSLISDPC
jgi:hypothetical protein